MLPSASLTPCASSAAEALEHMPLNGWLSYVEHSGGQFCSQSYGVFHWLFAAVLSLMVIPAIITALSIAFIFVRRRVKNLVRRERTRVARAAVSPAPAISAIIPCYLPNEQFLIEETIEWVMQKVESPGPLNLLIAYNTPHDIPKVEMRLQELQSRADWRPDRTFTALRVEDSTSKAANLNFALQQVSDPFCVIYDADHHPDPDSLLLLFEKLRRLDQDCVQGSYYMRNLTQNQFGCAPCTMPFISRIIDAEFFIDWFLMKLVTRTFLGSGYFCGSNALWRTDMLKSKEFDIHAQTEDVDMAIQQLLAKAKIEFCAESRSGELAPMTMRSVWKQRLRWTMGWDEAALKHGAAFTSTPGLTARARCGMIWTFLVRWVLMMLALGAVYVGFPLTLVWPLTVENWGKLITYLGQSLFIAGCVPWTAATLEAIIRAPARGCQGAIQVVFVFFQASPFGFAAFFVFNFLLQMRSCMKISTGNVQGWEVTQRAPAKKVTMTDDLTESTSLPTLSAPASQSPNDSDSVNAMTTFARETV